MRSSLLTSNNENCIGLCTASIIICRYNIYWNNYTGIWPISWTPALSSLCVCVCVCVCVRACVRARVRACVRVSE